MDSSYFSSLDGLASNGIDSPISPTDSSNTSKRTNALSTKIASVLSTSYADSEIRDGLRLLDLREGKLDDDGPLDLKSEAQKQVTDTNTKVIDDFGQVAEVRGLKYIRRLD